MLHRQLRSADHILSGPEPGIIGSLLGTQKLLSCLPHPRGCIFAWDSTRSARRLKLYPEYKANRKPPDEIYYKDFMRQRELLQQQFLPALGALSLEVPNREGDDLIAVLVEILKNTDTVLLSSDKDFYQLLARYPRLKIYNPLKSEFITCDTIKAKFDIHINHFLLYRAITGDDGDNISGVGGVGPKNAARVLSEVTTESTQLATTALFQWIGRWVADREENGALTRIGSIYRNWGIVARNLELMDLTREEFLSSEIESIKTTLINYTPKVRLDRLFELAEEHKMEAISRNISLFDQIM